MLLRFVGDQAVAHARLGDDVARRLGVGLELLA